MPKESHPGVNPSPMEKLHRQLEELAKEEIKLKKKFDIESAKISVRRGLIFDELNRLSKEKNN